MLIGNTKSCEACASRNVCRYVEIRSEFLKKLENQMDDMSSEVPFTLSISCNFFNSKSNIR